MTFFLNFRARPSGGGVQSPAVQGVTIAANGDPVLAAPPPSADDLAKAALGKNVLLATHGFNVNRQKGYQELGNWQTLLQLDDTFLFVGMVWPGDSSWLGPLSYPSEGKPAIQCGNLLADFISQNLIGAASLSFASHSLGALMLLQAIRQLAQAKIPVRQVALMAGAIDDDCLTNEYADAAQWVGRIDILASVKDEVLAWAFPVGNVAQEIIDDDSPYFSAALGHKGPRSQVPSKPTGPYQIPKGWDYGHHNYIEVEPFVPLAPPHDPPLDDNAPAPAPGSNWTPSWSAAFVSFRFSGGSQ